MGRDLETEFTRLVADWEAKALDTSETVEGLYTTIINDDAMVTYICRPKLKEILRDKLSRQGHVTNYAARNPKIVRDLLAGMPQPNIPPMLRKMSKEQLKKLSVRSIFNYRVGGKVMGEWTGDELVQRALKQQKAADTMLRTAQFLLTIGKMAGKKKVSSLPARVVKKLFDEAGVSRNDLEQLAA